MRMKSHQDVIAYLDSAPEEQKALLKWLRTEIRRALPDSEESFESKMPVYKRAGAWTAGFASRKKGVMFYVMDSKLLDGFAERLGKRRSGNSCIEMRDDMKDLAKEILAAVKTPRG